MSLLSIMEDYDFTESTVKIVISIVVTVALGSVLSTIINEAIGSNLGTLCSQILVGLLAVATIPTNFIDMLSSMTERWIK